MKQKKQKLSDDQTEALTLFAHEHGARWKSALRLEWERAMTGGFGRAYPNSAAVLQGLRNDPRFGPRGLDRYRPELPAFDFEARLEAYLAGPSLVRWEAIYSAVIPDTGRTLWQSWIHVDGAAPTQHDRGFESFPDAFTLRRAVRAAREGQVPFGRGALLASRSPAVPRQRDGSALHNALIGPARPRKG